MIYRNTPRVMMIQFFQLMLSRILLEMMGGVTARTGVKPCVGPKTIVMSFPRVICTVVVGLLALAKPAGRFAATEGMDVREVG